MTMSMTIACAVLGVMMASDATAEDKPNVKIVDGVIHVFPGQPKDAMIARYQIPGEQIWVGAVRRNGKTRQVRIHSRHGGRGTKTKKHIRIFYPFGTDSATWNMDVKRDGDVVSADMSWNATFLGERMDVDEGADQAVSMRAKLGVTGPVCKNLPVLYSSGDSISLGCWPYLEGELWKEVHVYYQRELWKDIPAARSPNNGHAHNAYRCLQTAYKSEAFRPDYMMVNVGLHMLSTHTNKQEEYGQWVQNFVDLSNEHNARLIWVTTTTPYGSFRAKQNLTIGQFNALASKIAKENKVPVIDLHACVTELVKELGERKVYTDGVHFTEDIKKQQAEFMAQRIREIIETEE